MYKPVLRFGICDDEPYWQDQIKALCQSYCNKKLISAEFNLFASGNELMTSECELHILFLDEELGDTSGLLIKEELGRKNGKVMLVFITSHDEILHDAFGRNVYGFIHKPIDKKTFDKKMDDLVSKLKQTAYIHIYGADGGPRKIPCKNILYIKAERNYCRLVLNDTEEVFIRKEIGDLEGEINCDFLFRTHKSYIVNLLQCYKINFSVSEIQFVDGLKVPISRRRKAILREAYSSLVEERAEMTWNI